MEKEKVQKLHLKKWDSQTVLEASLFPYREKLSAKTFKKETNITEHRMIRWMLEQIDSRIEQEVQTEKAAYENVKRIADDLQKLNTNNTIEGGRAIEKIRKRNEQLKEDIKELEERTIRWEALSGFMSSFIVNPLFDVPEEEPSWTHLFISHPAYQAVYEIYEQMHLF
ncbi:hypothetical protein BTO30_08760 [Domibacillus antri]|uniref:Uncharacterized protein n=1 Tax=Domibacillus antri TaxID=1714264 RepID=A0A1Q8Q5F6_9BACI|nr:hypothetical protein [Domibacillus antri]OLN22569.1 hypothetical protein BTO30_08760 [Domibacillus antri]